jgi:hypothetical protein
LPQNPLERWKPPGSLSDPIKRKPPAAGMGRKKGVPNKTTALLKDAILRAAEGAGGKEGLVGYLQDQAKKNPGPFLALLGKVLPTQVSGDPDNPVATPHTVEVIFVEAKDRERA